jgi:putative tryptophan/tyrosine transport system substrate-binding protein
MTESEYLTSWTTGKNCLGWALALETELAIRRRDFIALLASGAAFPLVAHAQKPLTPPQVGFLTSTSSEVLAGAMESFRQGLKETGYVEGQNISFEYRWAERGYDQLPMLAADLVRHQVSVIVATSTPAALAAKAAAATTPIVFQISGDPVPYGLVESLSRPGGNMTGIARLATTLGSKRLELLRQIVPTTSVIGVLVNPDNPESRTDIDQIKATADSIGCELLVLQARGDGEFENVFSSLLTKQAGGLIVAPDGSISGQRNRLVALAAHHGIPTIYDRREYAAIGGLMSYGDDRADSYRQLGIYVGRILKGTNPADLPVQQPTKFALVVNLKTAKALGITVPPTLLVAADETIE